MVKKLMKLSQKIKLLRKTHDMSQKEFAELMGLASDVVFRRIELGKQEPGSYKVQLICKKFPQYALWLMTDIDDISKVINQSPIKAGDH
jgi:transcriptional regulator with XRE-family HTH domain